MSRAEAFKKLSNAIDNISNDTEQRNVRCALIEYFEMELKEMRAENEARNNNIQK